ncbi:Dip2 [Drosophila busckii]|uniref:Dip2 n=1 Tax=Drosophila busckii TaxID=30019 RepID=A0A0M4EUN8_DROBS|nr:uncharacterized protein LOC108604698 [Drosophila busckii]ALC46855.1 Dip2 [Drosophila busckii]
MSGRICVYKGCNNLYVAQDKSGGHTFFSFPKDPKREKLWKLLGQVHPKIGPKQLFMCSKHFDEKYISVSKTRTILVGEAVPNAYEDRDEDEEYETHETKEMTVPSSSTQQSFTINLYDDLNNLEMVESTTATTSNEQADAPVEVKLLPLNKRKREASPIVTNNEPNAAADFDDKLLDSNEVSIFKFKGEEYVQMSKEYYLQEKRQMNNKLQLYNRILRGIRSQIQTLEEL